jgi:hypothetical protein
VDGRVHEFHFVRQSDIVSYILKMQVQNRHNVKYNGTVQGLKYIWKTEGFRGMFKGNGTNCARIIPNSAVKFFSYEQASKYVLHIIFSFHPPFINLLFQCPSDHCFILMQGYSKSLSVANWKWY